MRVGSDTSHQPTVPADKHPVGFFGWKNILAFYLLVMVISTAILTKLAKLNEAADLLSYLVVTNLGASLFIAAYYNRYSCKSQSDAQTHLSTGRRSKRPTLEIVPKRNL
ncbi:MAG: hypothetical protein EOP05_11905 [Proteobacteria bacterium]|nr:MAG: hypothetical protein EOP05_11905 [Pseudomonadota bacterium]